MVLQRAGQITGTITVLGESAYVGEVYAVLNGRYERGSGFGAQIDPKTGNYTLRGLPTGTYRIEASVRTSAATYQGFYPNGETIEEGEDVHLGIGQTLTDINMDIVYGPHFNGAIWGHVRAAGKALAGIRVDLINGCCTPSVVTYTFSDEKGAYAFNGLQENSVWTVAFVDPSGRYGRTFAGNSATLEGAAYYSAIAGIDTNVDADLQPGGRIRGAIHRNDGQPVSNLQVIVYLMLDGRAYQVANSTTTAADGTYDLGGLHIGTYRFCFRQFRPGAIECFSTIDGLENAYLGTDVQVAVDQTTEVNMVWGPDYEQYLPVVSR
ncbi:MAG: carboxypeptidase-like regulatory domain-containing protein [Caldilineaceae bacterium]